MAKTVQKLINNALNEGKKLSGYELQEILEKYKTEISEKNKEIKELKSRQLYKEDFIVHKYCINCFANNCRTCGLDKIIKLKDNSKYELLESKEELK